jgi:hypothetical protein
MFRQILYTQWKWSGTGIVAVSIAAFVLPILTVQEAGVPDPTWLDARQLLPAIEYWSWVYPVLALGTGLLAATTAWTHDHRGHHVYALSLPLPRWQYVLLRYSAGLVFLVVPVVLLWVGAMLATTMTVIPPGLHAYPHALALRFALAVLLAYSLLFAISSATTRTAGYVITVVVVLFVLQLLFRLAGSTTDLVSPLFDRLMTLPGPFQIFGGRWMLIDV